jgi:hypothetical protein
MAQVVVPPGLSQRRPRIDPRSVNVEFVVNGMTMKHFSFFECFRVSLQMLRTNSLVYFFFFCGAAARRWARAASSSSSRLLDHTQTQFTRYDSSGRVISSSYRPLPDKHHSQATDIHASGGKRTRISSKLSAADPRLRTRDHFDRLYRLRLFISVSQVPKLRLG